MWKFNVICINESLQYLGSCSENLVYAGLRNDQAGVVWRQHPQGQLEKLTFWEHYHTYPDSFSYHHHCVNQGKELPAAVLVKHNMAGSAVCRGRLQAAGKDHWEMPSPDAGYEMVKRALGKHREQYKYQGDLKAMVSFSQWLFKDSEYLDSFSFPVRNERIFLEIFLLFRHLSNSGSL